MSNKFGVSIHKVLGKSITQDVCHFVLYNNYLGHYFNCEKQAFALLIIRHKKITLDMFLKFSIYGLCKFDKNHTFLF